MTSRLLQMLLERVAKLIGMRRGHLRQRRDKLLLRATQIAKLIREHIL